MIIWSLDVVDNLIKSLSTYSILYLIILQVASYHPNIVQYLLLFSILQHAVWGTG